MAEKKDDKASLRQRPAQKVSPPRALSRAKKRHLAEQERVEREREESRRRVLSNVKMGGAYFITLVLVAAMSWWLLSVL